MNKKEYETKRLAELVAKQKEIVGKVKISVSQGNVGVSRKGKKYFYSLQKYDPLTRKKVTRYCKVTEIGKIKDIVTKEYYRKLRKILNDNSSISLLEEFENLEKKLDMVYKKMPEGKKILITPLYGTASFIYEAWKSESYSPNPSHPEHLIFYTNRGELVRSKSEMFIANLLDSFKDVIDYKYERPLKVTVNGSLKTIYPDFTIINIATGKIWFLEHIGRLDDEEYRDSFVWKTYSFIESDLYTTGRILYTFETNNQPINSKMIEKMIREIICND